MMKKIVLGSMLLGTLVSSAFSGNMGYVWMPSRNLAYDVIDYADSTSEYIVKADLKKGLPDINSIIRIEANNRMYLDFSLIQNISKEFLALMQEGKCERMQGMFSVFMLNKDKYCSVDNFLERIKSEYPKDEPLYYPLPHPIKAKVLGYVELQAGVFVLVEQKEMLSNKTKDK